MLITLLTLMVNAHAGFFHAGSAPTPKQFDMGGEFTYILGTPSGSDLQLRGRYGVTESQQLGVLLGTGAATRAFRVGAWGGWEFFPDLSTQPALGLNIQTVFVHLVLYGPRLEIMGQPYLHKQLHLFRVPFDFFATTPVGISLGSSPVLSFGGQLGLKTKLYAQLFLIIEAGLGFIHYDSQVSCGVSYLLPQSL